jgi:uncharacterized membrane protein
VQKRDWACFLVVVVAALSWRCVGLTFDSLWLDEGYQTIVDSYGQRLPDFFAVPAQGFIFSPQALQPASPAQVLQHFREVDPLTPPLYQLLLNRWIAAFGGSDAALRGLSILFSTAATAALFLTARALFGWRSALWAGLLQAFSPFDVYYGQEVRMYSLEELAATLSCGALLVYLWRPLRLPARLALLLLHAVAVWALINSHYTGLFLFAFEIGLGVCVALARRSGVTLLELLGAWALAFLLWVPWLPMFLQAASLRTASFYVARRPSLLWPFTALILRIPANWIVFLSGKQVVTPALPIYGTSFLLLVLGLRQLIARPPISVPASEHRRRRLALLSVLAWAVVPALLLWLIDVVENHRVVEISRYLMPTEPAIFLLAGAGIAALGRRSRWLWALVACHFVFCVVNNIGHATVVHQREPWRDMAHLVESTVPAGELVLVSQYYDILCLDRYLSVPLRQVGVSSNTTAAQLTKMLKGSDRFSLVTAQEGDRILKQIPGEFMLVISTDLGHSLHFLRYVRN